MTRFTLSGLVAGLVAIAVLSMSAMAGDGGIGDPVGIPPKCCKPASPKAPTGACPAPPCATSVVCTPSSETTSWVKGRCIDAEEATCLLFTAQDLEKPVFRCTFVACELDDGTPGVTCGWVMTGTAPGTSQDVVSCNGTPCP